MKILFDQGTPDPLRQCLSDHSIDTAYEKGWSTLTNGDLLEQLTSENYEVFISTDQNLNNQQNLSNYPLAVIVLSTTSWPRIQKNTNKIEETLEAIQPGDYKEISIP